MPEIGPSSSMRGMWKRSHGLSIAAPPDERGGNSCDRPTATAPHLYSTSDSPQTPIFRVATSKVHFQHDLYGEAVSSIRVRMTPSAAYKSTDSFFGMAHRTCSEDPLTFSKAGEI
jgi:hypothetical protein